MILNNMLKLNFNGFNIGEEFSFHELQLDKKLNVISSILKKNITAMSFALKITQP